MTAPCVGSGACANNPAERPLASINVTRRDSVLEAIVHRPPELPSAIAEAIERRHPPDVISFETHTCVDPESVPETAPGRVRPVSPPSHRHRAQARHDVPVT